MYMKKYKLTVNNKIIEVDGDEPIKWVEGKGWVPLYPQGDIWGKVMKILLVALAVDVLILLGA